MDKIYIIENYVDYGGFSINSVIYGSSDYSNVCQPHPPKGGCVIQRV